MSWDFDLFSKDLDFLGRVFDGRLGRLAHGFDFSGLIRYLDARDASKFASLFFGDGDYFALGIDGSMEHRERLEVIVLYVAVAGYRCIFRVNGENLEVDLNSVERDGRFTTSAIIPLWLDDINEILGSSELGLYRSLETIIGNIPFSIMTFGEYLMGYYAAKDDEKVKVIFYDRPFASSIGPYSRDLRRLIFQDEGGALTRFTKLGLTKGDLYLGLYYGVKSYRFPQDRPYQLYKVLEELIRNNGETRLSYLEKIIKTPREKIIKRLSRLNQLLDKTLIEEITPDKILLVKERLNYWSKIRNLIQYTGEKIFNRKRDVHPLYLGEGIWLGSREINSIILYTIYDTINYMNKYGKLFIGIGKDTYVTDLSRALIPLTNHLGITNLPEVPIKSDKPLLTTLSTIDQKTFKTPWRLITYDGVIATLTKCKGCRAPLRPARKRLTLTKLIARSYFQLRTLEGINNINVKSPVFFYDRFLTNQDREETISIPIKINNKTTQLEIYLETGRNKIDNLILYLLSKMDNPEIAEATGHNYLLFLADKDVKTYIKLVRDTAVNAVDTKITQIIRSKNIYVVTTRFREYRQKVERRRSK